MSYACGNEPHFGDMIRDGQGIVYTVHTVQGDCVYGHDARGGDNRDPLARKYRLIKRREPKAGASTARDSHPVAPLSPSTPTEAQE